MSQEEFTLFGNVAGGFHKLLQAILFLVMWDIFFRPARERRTFFWQAPLRLPVCFCMLVRSFRDGPDMSSALSRFWGIVVSNAGRAWKKLFLSCFCFFIFTG